MSERILSNALTVHSDKPSSTIFEKSRLIFETSMDETFVSYS